MRINSGKLDKLPPEQREEIQGLLEDLQKKYEDNPLLKYHPHPKQVEFHESKNLIKAFMGGNRSGKTTAGVVDDIIQAVDEGCLPGHLKPYKKFTPPFHCRIVTPAFDVLEGVVFQKLREWCPRDQLSGGAFDKAYSKSRRILSFKNGSFFDFLTYEQTLDKFSGAAKHRLHYDEEPPFDIRQEGRARLIDYSGADELFTMTPLLGLSWMYDKIWEPYQKGKLPYVFIVTVDMDDNPYLDEAQKKLTLEGYSKEELQARKEGKFVHFAGMIYPEFSRTHHVIPESDVPDNANIFVGIDPGIRHMAAVVWLYLTVDDELVIFDEFTLQGGTIEDVCKAIQVKNALHRRQPRSYIIDPAARNIVHQTGRSDQAEYARHGIVTIPGQNDVGAGINAVKERLQNGRLRIMANCKVTIDEFRKYRWSTPGRSENEPKQKPVKEDDHCLDAVRYVVFSMPLKPKRKIAEDLFSPLEKRAHEEMSGKTYKQTKVPVTPMGGIFA